MLAHEVSLRNLVPRELAKGFGFLQSKPPSAFSPVTVTQDELGDAWRDGKVRLPLLSRLNGEPFGRPDAGVDMTAGFPRLIAHAARTRPLAAGTIVGSGTDVDADPAVGSSCITERRTREALEHGTARHGTARTPYVRFGDTVRIEALDVAGHSIFGAIEQTVRRYEGVV